MRDATHHVSMSAPDQEKVGHKPPLAFLYNKNLAIKIDLQLKIIQYPDKNS